MSESKSRQKFTYCEFGSGILNCQRGFAGPGRRSLKHSTAKAHSHFVKSKTLAAGADLSPALFVLAAFESEVSKSAMRVSTSMI